MKQMIKSSTDGISRRTFVAASAAAAAGTALAPPLFAQSGAEEVLSVGYWQGSIKGKWVVELSRGYPILDVQDAADILSPDPGFISRGATLSVYGLWRPEPRRGVPLAVDVDVLFQLEEGSEQPIFPFRAYSYGFRNGVASASSPMRLAIPVRPDANFEIRTTRRLGPIAERERGARLAPGNRVETVTRFGVMHDSQVRMRPGTYFLALPDGDASGSPRWHNVRIARPGGKDLTPGGHGVLRRGTTSQPVDFSYLILGVETGS